MKEGWKWPVNANKAHFFREARALCGKWLFFGKDMEPDLASGKSPDQCKICEKKRLKEREIQ